ncbi:MAG: MBL fold metallo-hydrolase [Candidatus Bathyarchaeia archaeon]|jgi:glyoxylase-like metal-dependent hydrolase (beta-lactamase superfamily II)
MLTQQILGPVYLIDSPYWGSQGVLGTYVVKGGEPMLIDPGPTSQVSGALEGLRELGIRQLRYVGLTHIHLDHGGGAWKVIEAHPEADVYAHPKAVEHLVDPSRLAASAKQFFGPAYERYGEVRGLNPMKIQESQDGEVLDLQGATLKVIWTPGHASHGQSFWEPDYRIIILGDCGGSFSRRSGSIFPITPPPFNLERALETLDKLIALRPEIICYSHFGYSYDAVKKLVFYRGELQTWGEVVGRGVKEGLDLNGIWELLKEQDPILRLSLDEDGNRRTTAIPNIIGLVEYTKWKLKEEVAKSS